MEFVFVKMVKEVNEGFVFEGEFEIDDDDGEDDFYEESSDEKCWNVIIDLLKVEYKGGDCEKNNSVMLKIKSSGVEGKDFEVYGE